MFVIKLQPPTNLPVGSMYTVTNGSGLTSLASDLANKNIIKSPFLFKSFSVLFGGTKGIMAGDYIFNSRSSVIHLAWRFSRGQFDLNPVKVTFPEGLNVSEISTLVAKKFTKINPDLFNTLASSSEGYLFPDTYYFLPNVLPAEIIKVMTDNFQERIKTVTTELKSFNKPLTDIIKMASIVEDEARTMETRQIVAGILWRRLSLNMPLQVDASFKYINGKGTKDLTLADLKIDSPYNSYLYKGLPPTPICNPGLNSIKATVTPIKTDYLYFLTDKKGEMHYAKTYQEHLLNKEKYLE